MHLKNFLSSRNLKLSIVGSTVLFGVIASEIPVAQSAALSCASSGSLGGSLPVIGVDVSNAYTCIDIGGIGLRVTRAQVYWTGAGRLCNYQFKIKWYSSKTGLYNTSTSPYYSGCTSGFAKKLDIDYQGGVIRREGRACGELYQSGELRGGSPCVNISR